MRFNTTSLKGTYNVNAEIRAYNGSLITDNEYRFDVFSFEQLAVPAKRIAVLDPSNSLKPFLKKSGIAFEEFGIGTDRSLPVFVSRTEAKTKEQKELFKQVNLML